jgi:hypothetical protein
VPHELGDVITVVLTQGWDISPPFQSFLDRVEIRRAFMIASIFFSLATSLRYATGRYILIVQMVIGIELWVPSG